MYKLLPLLLLASAIAQDKQGGDLESVLQGLFGTPPPTGGQATAAPATTQATIVSPSTIVPPPRAGDDKDKTCKTDSGVTGECLPYYLCNSENNTAIKDGQGLIDIRAQDGPCESYMDTCCLVDDVRPPDDPITPAPPPVPAPTGCGYRNPDGVGFKTTGDVMGEAKFGEFPWMVAVLTLEPINDNDPTGQLLNVYVGGGSLIHPRVVLTAAHYVHATKTLRVRAGEWDTQTKKEIYPYQDRDVASVEVHKDFNKGNLFYDIAVLFLSAPMDLAPNVGVACLPPQGARVAAGTRCFASGWGKDKFDKAGRYQVIMKKVELPVVDRATCQRELRKTRLGRYFELHPTFMCAGGDKQDTCKGDGGSPLVCPIEFEENRYVQSGIVAWGIGCGEDGTPGVYVDVGRMRDWIDDKVTGKGYELTYNVVGLTA